MLKHHVKDQRTFESGKVYDKTYCWFPFLEHFLKGNLPHLDFIIVASVILFPHSLFEFPQAMIYCVALFTRLCTFVQSTFSVNINNNNTSNLKPYTHYCLRKDIIIKNVRNLVRKMWRHCLGFIVPDDMSYCLTYLLFEINISQMRLKNITNIHEASPVN